MSPVLETPSGTRPPDASDTTPPLIPAPGDRTGVGGRRGGDDTVLDIVVPVHDEQDDVERSVHRLLDHMRGSFPYSFRITVADNASTDATPVIAARLAATLPEVRSVRLEAKGRGRALREVWSASDALVLAYCDVDLSTDLDAVLPLVAPLVSGHSDLAIGTRLSRASRVVRGARREFISRSYNLILRGALSAGFSDAQCGFKAIRSDVARRLLPLVEDAGWFFDTELLVLAERAGLRIHEVPVDWVDDPKSSVDVVRTAADDLKGVWRVGRALATGALPLGEIRAQLGRGPLEPTPLPGVPTTMPFQLARFAAIGVASTVVNLALFLALRGLTGAIVANVVAMLVCAIANTAANRRFTFGVRGRERATVHQFQGLVVFGLGLLLTTGALALLGVLAPGAHTAVEVAVIVAANLVATLVRFVLFRSWVFRSRHGRSGSPSSPSGSEIPA